MTSPYGFLWVRLAVDPDGHGHRQSWQLLAKLNGFLGVPAAQSFAQGKGKVLSCVTDRGACDLQNNTHLERTHCGVISKRLNWPRRSHNRTNIKSGLTLFQLGRCVLVSHRYIGNNKSDTVCNERQLPSVETEQWVDRFRPMCPDEPRTVRATNKQKHCSLVKVYYPEYTGSLSRCLYRIESETGTTSRNWTAYELAPPPQLVTQMFTFLRNRNGTVL